MQSFIHFIKTRPVWLQITGGIFLLLPVYILAAVILSLIPTKKEKASGEDVLIYIMTNGMHTDIVMPARNNLADWREEFISKKEAKPSNSLQWIAVGWGNRDFYLNTPTWADLKFKTAVTAASGVGESLFHTVWYYQIWDDETVRGIYLSEEQYLRLADYIRSWMKKDETGDIIPVASNEWYGPRDYFYKAKGRYCLFYTCNSWANDALKACGQRACLWTPVTQAIFYHYPQP